MSYPHSCPQDPRTPLRTASLPAPQSLYPFVKASTLCGLTTAWTTDSSNLILKTRISFVAIGALQISCCLIDYYGRDPIWASLTKLRVETATIHVFLATFEAPCMLLGAPILGNFSFVLEINQNGANDTSTAPSGQPAQLVYWRCTSPAGTECVSPAGPIRTTWRCSNCTPMHRSITPKERCAATPRRTVLAHREMAQSETETAHRSMRQSERQK